MGGKPAGANRTTSEKRSARGKGPTAEPAGRRAPLTPGPGPPPAHQWAAEGLSEPVILEAPPTNGLSPGQGTGRELSEPVILETPPPRLEHPNLGRASHTARARLRIAQCSIAILAFVVVAAFTTIWLGDSIESLTRLLEIIFAPIVALVAAAVAFYYSSKSQ